MVRKWFEKCKCLSENGDDENWFMYQKDRWGDDSLMIKTTYFMNLRRNIKMNKIKKKNDKIIILSL